MSSALALFSGMVMLAFWMFAPVQAFQQYAAQTLTAPSSAVTLILAGLCLLLLLQTPTPLRTTALLLSTITLIAIGGSTIAAELIRPDLRLPLDAFFAPTSGDPVGVAQMPDIGFNTALFGLALLILRATRWCTMLSQILALLVLLNSLRDLALTSSNALRNTLDQSNGAPIVSLIFALLTISLLLHAPPPQLFTGVRRAGPGGECRTAAPLPGNCHSDSDRIV